MACHLHPILCTEDAVVTCTRHCLLSTRGAVMLLKKRHGSGAWLTDIGCIALSFYNDRQEIPSRHLHAFSCNLEIIMFTISENTIPLMTVESVQHNVNKHHMH